MRRSDCAISSAQAGSIIGEHSGAAAVAKCKPSEQDGWDTALCRARAEHSACHLPEHPPGRNASDTLNQKRVGATIIGDLGDLQHLPGFDFVRVLQLVLVQLKDAHVGVGVTEGHLRDLAQRVSWLHSVGLR